MWNCNRTCRRLIIDLWELLYMVSWITMIYDYSNLCCLCICMYENSFTLEDLDLYCGFLQLCVIVSYVTVIHFYVFISLRWEIWIVKNLYENAYNCNDLVHSDMYMIKNYDVAYCKYRTIIIMLILYTGVHWVIVVLSDVMVLNMTFYVCIVLIPLFEIEYISNAV